MRKYIALFFVLFFVQSSFSFEYPTWGSTGHRTIGEIANKYLKKRVKRKIKKILDGQSIAYVSTFADEIKSDRNYDKYYTWHYINFPFDTDYNKSKKNPKGDLVTGIATCVSVLKDKNSTKKDKAFYLKMLIHLIGDLHQPLHVGRSKDKGGNTIQLQWFGKGTNLHRVWDENLIKYWNMSYTELANNTKKLSKKELNEMQKGTVLDWVYDSQKQAKIVYASAHAGDKLKYKYSYNYFGIVQNQLLKGGVRLAKLLDDIFK